MRALLVRVRRHALASAGALYIWRVPLLLAVGLVLLAVFGNGPMVAGLYYVTGSAAFAAGLLFALLSALIFTQLRILQVHGPDRFGTDLPAGATSRPRTIVRGTLTIGLTLAPLGFNLWRLLDLADNRAVVAIWSGLGVGLVAALFVLFAYLQHRAALVAADPQIFPSRLFRKALERPPRPCLERFTAWLERGFVRAVRVCDGDGRGFLIASRLRTGHLLLLLLFGVVLGVYVVGYFYAWAGHDQSTPGFPAVVYLLLWLFLLGSFLGAACFTLDLYRVPAITALAVLAFAISWMPANQHYYALEDRGAGDIPSIDALLAGPEPRLIVVSAEGGGIFAAGWTTQVLTGILEQLPGAERADFLRSVRLLSGVSGGSAGLMFFQTLLGRDRVTLDHLHAVRDASVADGSLAWVGYGLVYYDLLRPVWPYFFYSPADRGRALERTWQAQLDRLVRTLGDPPGTVHLGDLAENVRAGRRPLLLWNTTIADTGRPVAFGNFSLGPSARLGLFSDLYPAKDVALTTAVRLSATFPYVSPMARPLAAEGRVKPALALCDGGYTDNFGVVGAYAAIEEAVKRRPDIKKPVLWIQVRSSSPGGADEPHAIASTSLGPIWTLYGVRGTGQRARMEILNQLAETVLSGRLTIVAFEYGGKDAALSWVLSARQKTAIARAWSTGSWTRQIEAIKTFLR